MTKVYLKGCVVHIHINILKHLKHVTWNITRVVPVCPIWERIQNWTWRRFYLIICQKLTEEKSNGDPQAMVAISIGLKLNIHW